MSITLIGQLATRLGLAVQYDRAGDADHFTMPADLFRREQPAELPLRMGHDDQWQIGTVRYLERSRADGLPVGATVDVDMADLWAEHGPHFLSPRLTCAPTGRPPEHGHRRLSGGSAVKRPATRWTKPVLWSDIALGSGGGDPAGMPLAWHDTWARAHERAAVERYRRRAEHLVIHDVDPLDLASEAVSDPAGVRRRAVAELAAVRAKAKPVADEGGRSFVRRTGTVTSYR